MITPEINPTDKSPAKISVATPRDLPHLLPMIGKLCAHHGDACDLGLARAHREFFSQSRLIALIARVADAPVGYAVLESRWRPMSTGDGYEIAHLFIEVEWRGKGIGRALVAAARSHAQAQGAVQLRIGTVAENTAAAEAYRAMGMTEMTAPVGPRFAIALGE